MDSSEESADEGGIDSGDVPVREMPSGTRPPVNVPDRSRGESATRGITRRDSLKAGTAALASAVGAGTIVGMGEAVADQTAVVEIGSTHVEEGETTTVPVFARNTPANLSTFWITVSVDKTDIIEVTDGVLNPDFAGPWSGFNIRTEDGSTADFASFEPDSESGGDPTDFQLGVIEFQGKREGETTVSISIVHFGNDGGVPADGQETTTVVGDVADTAFPRQYDASTLDFDDGAQVDVWKATTGLDAVQPDSSRQPTYVEAGIGGNPSVAFDGDASLEAGELEAELEQPYSFVLVAEWDEAVSTNSYAFYGADTEQTSFLEHNGDEFVYYAGRSGGITRPGSGRAHVFVCVADGEDSVIRVDEMEVRADAGDLAQAGLTIGARSDGTRGMLGEIAELRWYDRRLSQTERSEVVEDLTAKWLSERGPAAEVARFDVSALDRTPESAVDIWPAAVGDLTATQADNAAQPTYVEDGINFNPAVSFDGDAWLHVGEFDEELEQPYTFVLVAEWDEAVSTNSYAFYGADTEQTSFLEHNGDEFVYYAGRSGGITQPGSGRAHVFVCVADGEDSVIRVDDEAVVGDAGELDLAGLTIGSRAEGTRGMVGDIAELRCYDGRIADRQRDTLVAELGEKWDIDSLVVDSFADGTIGDVWDNGTDVYSVVADADAPDGEAIYREDYGSMLIHDEDLSLNPAGGWNYVVWTMTQFETENIQVILRGSDPDPFNDGTFVAASWHDGSMRIWYDDGEVDDYAATTEVELPTDEYLTGVASLDADDVAHFWLYDSDEALIGEVHGEIP